MMSYAVVRCHGLRTHLLPKEKILELVKSKNLQEFANKLFGTPYEKKIRNQKINLELFTRVFINTFIERLLIVCKVTPSDCAEFLKNYFMKIELDWVISILIKKLKKEPISPAEIPVTKIIFIDLRELSSVKTFEDAINLLIKYKPYNKIKPEFIHKILEEQSILLLNRVLWSFYYRNLIQSITAIPKDSRKIIEKIIGMETDIANCIMALSTYLYKFPPEITRELIIPYSYRINLRTLEKIISERNKDVILKLLSPYEMVIRTSLEKGETLAYALAQKLIRGYLEKIRVKYSMKFAFIFYYLKMAEFEYKDLTTCSFGVYHHIPFEKLKDFLILID